MQLSSAKKYKGIVFVVLTLTIMVTSYLLHNNIKGQAVFSQELETKNAVPILMYHSISDKGDNPYIIKVKQFKEEMEYLKDQGYTTINLEDLNLYINDKIKLGPKTIAITFDDGYEDNFINAYPILKECGFKAAIFVVPSYLDKGTLFLNTKDLNVLQNNGVDIESHTYNHDFLSKLTYEEQLKSLKKGKEEIEKNLNKKVNFLAYPFGAFNEDTLKAAKEAGYKMAFTINGGWVQAGAKAYKLNRVYIGPNTKIEEFKDRIENPDYSTK